MTKPEHASNVCAPLAFSGGKEGEKKEEIGKGKQQIIESKRRLLRVKYRTDQDVTNVRVAGDERENAHRIQEEQTRQVGGWVVAKGVAHMPRRLQAPQSGAACGMCMRHGPCLLPPRWATPHYQLVKNHLTWFMAHSPKAGAPRPASDATPQWCMPCCPMAGHA